MANTFNYQAFNDDYTNIKNAVGSMQDTDDSTIGGVINSLNTDIRNDLEYAENSLWASSKLNDWNEMYPSLVNAYNNLVNLLDAAKVAADQYNAFENQNKGIIQS